MKKYISLISVICVMLLIAGMMTACGSNKADEAQKQAEQAEKQAEQAEEQAEQQAEEAQEQAENKEIGEDAALKIALEDAGLSESDVEVTKNKLDMDDGVTEYEIEFRKGTVEYDYSIEAFNGKILEKDSEDESIDD